MCQNLLPVTPQIRPELDPDFLPAVLWNRTFAAAVATDPAKRQIEIGLQRPNGCCSVFRTAVFGAGDAQKDALNLFYVERIVKFLLWQKGGAKLLISGAPEIADGLRRCYCADGARAFDYKIMGQRIYKQDFEILAVTGDIAEKEMQVALGGHLDGCRIGFDLGGSDRKCAAVMDGEVLHTEEVAWDPYFQHDPAYHQAGILDSIERAAKHLPRVDAIGGSAAGVYVDNQPRLASLFRGIPDELFDREIVPLFDRIKQKYQVPLIVANDGEVTALAGAMSMQTNQVLGLSMGTSQAVGFVNGQGNITDWLNELAFAPVDYRADAPADEWSGDIGCGVQYFSQQAVGRLIKPAQLEFEPGLPLPKQLELVQSLMKQNDGRAAKIYRTIGTYFGYAIAHYAAFYEVKNLLILGRVSSGVGGEIIIAEAQKVLNAEFPELSDLAFRVPDEQFKRHGQAVIAASLPQLAK